MNALELEAVCKSFGAVCAVNELTVGVPAGCVYGFLGPNGAGKTTTLRMVMDIIRPDSGTVRLFDGRQPSETRRRIGYMPEERGLYRKMTVEGVLAYFGSLKGLTRDQLKESVPRWLKRIALSEHARKKVEELSRGMHQKLQFAVTAISDPELLILDEPFSGLDPVNQDLIRDIITQMRGEGKTVVFSTHVMAEAERLCDLIVLINRGRVLINGSLEDIRSGYECHTLSVELEDDGRFVCELPMVRRVTADGSRLDVELVDEADPQDLLKALVDRARVRAFEIKQPSLHEIFVRLVGADHGQDS